MTLKHSHTIIRIFPIQPRRSSSARWSIFKSARGQGKHSPRGNDICKREKRGEDWWDRSTHLEKWAQYLCQEVVMNILDGRIGLELQRTIFIYSSFQWYLSSRANFKDLMLTVNTRRRTRRTGQSSIGTMTTWRTKVKNADLTPMLIIMLTVALIFLLIYPASQSNVFLFNADLQWSLMVMLMYSDRLAAKLARKESLSTKLEQRPGRQELIDRNILYQVSTSFLIRVLQFISGENWSSHCQYPLQ